MLITQVELHNIKSYLQQTVRFTEGTNAICGENGAGKTTLVEAIGFTLFDFLPNNQNGLVREGEKTATITTSFISSHDEREYQVVRRCGSSSQYYVYDPEMDARLVTGKADVTAWLRQHLGVEATTDLSALFRDALGVPQGLLTATFLEKASQRKPVFDRMLKVDEYAQVYAESRETVSYVRDQIGQAAARIAGLEANVSRLPGLRQQVQALQKEIKGLDQRQGVLATELGQIGQRRQALEATARSVMTLTQEAERCQSRLAALADKLAAVEKAADQSRLAQAELDQSQPGYQAYLSAQEVIGELEQIRVKKDRLLAEAASLEKTLARSHTQVEQLQANLQAIANAQHQLAELAPQVAQQADMETRRDQLRQATVTLQQISKQRAAQQQELAHLADEMSRLETGLAEAARLEKTQQVDREALAQAQAKRLELTSLVAGTEAERIRADQQAQALATAETAQCPVCEQPLTPDHRQGLLDENRKRQTKLQQQASVLQAEAAQLTRLESDLNRSIETSTRRLRQLPRSEDRTGLQERLTATTEKLAALEAEITGLAGVDQDLAQLGTELDRLGNPRRQHDLLTAQVARADTLQEQLQGEQQAVAAIEENLREIENSLAPLADWDERTARQRQVLGQNLSDYQRYLTNNRLAGELEARQQEAETLAGQVTGAETQLADARTQLETAAAGFDPAELEQVRQQETSLGREQAMMEGQLATLGRQLDNAGKEIAGLEHKEIDLADEQKQQSERDRVLSLVRIFRDTIRDAGPHVIRRLAQRVSLHATRLYAAILADHTCRLIWQEDYSIQMEKDGRTRDFEMLSGGEQMAAALSIRLALLKELSAIDVAFFDEPTSNLDEIRRENLAEQIVAIRNTGFSQVFVISHDDTFEQSTDNIVRVVKQNGESRAETG